MSTFQLLSFISNIVLGSLVLSHYLPKVIQSYKENKKQRETQANKGREEVIRRIVREYLEELKNE